MEEASTIQMAQNRQSIIDAIGNYSKRLFSFIRSRVQNDEEAEDILQDVWYQLSALIDIRPIEQLSSWLYRVATNKIIDKSRKKKPQLLEDFSYVNDEGETVFPEGLLEDDDSNPEEEFENSYLREILMEALEKLPEKQRQVFVMNEIEKYTLQEIADMTGENIKTLISRKRYAVNRLRELLKEINKEYKS